MKLAIIGDSISTRNNGAAWASWPELLESMIRSLGVFGWTVDNFSLPGLTWKTAYVPTDGWKIGGTCPVGALEKAGPYDLILVMLGVNDRTNPNALQFAQTMRDWLPNTPTGKVGFVAEHFLLDDGLPSKNSVVTLEEAKAMELVYASFSDPFFGCNLAKLYDCGYTYDQLHPTDSGKQWIASSVYMGLQLSYPELTPITRNIAWLYAQTPAVREQMRLANT